MLPVSSSATERELYNRLASCSAAISEPNRERREVIITSLWNAEALKCIDEKPDASAEIFLKMPAHIRQHEKQLTSQQERSRLTQCTDMSFIKALECLRRPTGRAASTQPAATAGRPVPQAPTANERLQQAVVHEQQVNVVDSTSASNEPVIAAFAAPPPPVVGGASVHPVEALCPSAQVVGNIQRARDLDDASGRQRQLIESAVQRVLNERVLANVAPQQNQPLSGSRRMRSPSHRAQNSSEQQSLKICWAPKPGNKTCARAGCPGAQNDHKKCTNDDEDSWIDAKTAKKMKNDYRNANRRAKRRRKKQQQSQNQP